MDLLTYPKGISYSCETRMKTSDRWKENLENQSIPSADQNKKLNAIEQEAIAKFKGDLGELESALGMLRLGQQYGWRVIYLIHSKATVKKYEKILGVSIKDAMPEVGPSTNRSLGYRVFQKIGNFWKIVSGEKKVTEKRKTE